MELSPSPDAAEQEYRVEQMIANIARMRANEEKLRSDLRYESRKFAVQTVLAAAALLGAGAALGNYFSPHNQAVPAAPQIIVIPQSVLTR